jgi:hypothetical protein
VADNAKIAAPKIRSRINLSFIEAYSKIATEGIGHNERHQAKATSPRKKKLNHSPYVRILKLDVEFTKNIRRLLYVKYMNECSSNWRVFFY